MWRKKKLGLWGGKVGILWGPQILKWSCEVHRSWGVKAFTSLHQFRHAKCPCTQLWAFSARLVPILGVQRPFTSHFWRWTPEPCLFWAFSARMLSILGVQRQNHALFWRWTPDRCFLQGVIFLLLFLIPFSIFNIYFVTPHDHEPNKTWKTMKINKNWVASQQALL